MRKLAPIEILSKNTKYTYYTLLTIFTPALLRPHRVANMGAFMAQGFDIQENNE